MIKFVCYEPAGLRLELSPDDVSRHILAVGATGSGKTTGLVNPALQQLLEWRASSPQAKAGLLILDAKADETQEKVLDWARQAGRLKDVLVLSESSDAYYDYFAGFRTLDQIDEFTERALLGTRDMGQENSYWSETRFGLVSTALVLLLADGKPSCFETAIEFLSAWVYARDSETVTERLAITERLLARGSLSPVLRRRLQLALWEADNWRKLDERTRELHRSTLSNALRPLMSPAAHLLFDVMRPSRFDVADVLTGKILVASVPVVPNRGFAALLFKALKQDFYKAVLSRLGITPERNRACGLIVDEFPLIATPEDVEMLSVIRSKGGFVIACAQTLGSLDAALGKHLRSSLLTNFNSTFFFSSRENETDEHAMLTLGVNGEEQSADASIEFGDVQDVRGAGSWRSNLICPPGALARLTQHQAYVKLADGRVSNGSVSLIPEFYESTGSRPASNPDQLTRAVNALDHQDEAMLSADVPMFLLHMHREGHRLCITPALVSAAWQLCRSCGRRSAIAARFGDKIAGLDSLPTCWLAQFERWQQKNELLASTIVSVKATGGVFWTELDRSSRLWGDGPVIVPESLNLFIYPSLWKPLRERDVRRLREERPDLRDELGAAMAGFGSRDISDT